MNSGVYQIINDVTQRCYIGSTVNLQRRFSDHKRDLNRGTHHSPILQNAWNKHGESKFRFEIIEKCEKSHLIEREQYYFNILNPEYNICRIAGNCLGIKRSDETRMRMSQSLSGRKLSEEHKQKLRKSRSEDTKIKMSIAKSGENHPMYHRSHSEETKQKMRDARFAYLHLSRGNRWQLQK